jgi:hypothetical protein
MRDRLLFPRLGSSDAEVLVADIVSGSEPTPSLTHPNQWYAPLGGRPANAAHLAHIAESARTAASGPSTAEASGDVIAGPALDAHLGWAIHQSAGLSRTEAAHPSVWAFLTLVLLPDLAVQRFPDPHPSRLLGGQRNVFRRTWWRVEVLGDLAAPDRPGALGEDEYVGVFERVSLGRDERLARALVMHLQAWEGDNRSEYARGLTRTLLRDMPHTSLVVLDEERLSNYVDSIGARLGRLDDGKYATTSVNQRRRTVSAAEAPADRPAVRGPVDLAAAPPPPIWEAPPTPPASTPRPPTPPSKGPPRAAEQASSTPLSPRLLAPAPVAASPDVAGRADAVLRWASSQLDELGSEAVRRYLSGTMAIAPHGQMPGRETVGDRALAGGTAWDALCLATVALRVTTGAPWWRIGARYLLAASKSDPRQVSGSWGGSARRAFESLAGLEGLTADELAPSGSSLGLTTVAADWSVSPMRDNCLVGPGARHHVPDAEPVTDGSPRPCYWVSRP